MNKKIAVSTVVFTIMLLSGCYYLQDAEVPVQFEHYFASGDENIAANDVLILLPGIGDYANAYKKRGFVEALQRQYNIDVIAVNAHFKYYENRSLLERLALDIMPVAIAKGYSQINIGGISLGGYGSLLYFRDHSRDINAVIIFAPYLGESQHYIDYQESLESGVTIADEGNLWPWLHNLDSAERNKIFILYGLQDKFSSDNTHLAELLPSGHSFTQPGAHDWPTWNSLWQDFLTDTNPFLLKQ